MLTIELISCIFIQWRWFPSHESPLSRCVAVTFAPHVRQKDDARIERISLRSFYQQQPCGIFSLPAAPLLWPCGWQQPARAGNYVWPASGPWACSLLLPATTALELQPCPRFPNARRQSSNYPGNRRAARGRKQPRAADLCQR